MSDTQTDQTQTEPEGIQQIRERAEQLPAALEHNAIRDLEMGLLRGPGIDLATKQGRAWAAQYDGDWTDSDAMKADFSELFPSVTDAGEPPVEESYQTGMTDEMRTNQSGQTSLPGQAGSRVGTTHRMGSIPDREC